jgi:hypothetical protein
MATIQEFDLTRESGELQDFAEEVRRLINNGNMEIEVTTAASPAYTAPQETKFVLSIFGATFRFYISYLGDWYYVGLTKLP